MQPRGKEQKGPQILSLLLKLKSQQPSFFEAHPILMTLSHLLQSRSNSMRLVQRLPSNALKGLRGLCILQRPAISLIHQNIPLSHLLIFLWYFSQISAWLICYNMMDLESIMCEISQPNTTRFYLHVDSKINKRKKTEIDCWLTWQGERVKSLKGIKRYKFQIIK